MDEQSCSRRKCFCFDILLQKVFLIEALKKCGYNYRKKRWDFNWVFHNIPVIAHGIN